jgi:hypothetical protein
MCQRKVAELTGVPTVLFAGCGVRWLIRGGSSHKIGLGQRQGLGEVLRRSDRNYEVFVAVGSEQS